MRRFNGSALALAFALVGCASPPMILYEPAPTGSDGGETIADATITDAVGRVDAAPGADAAGDDAGGAASDAGDDTGNAGGNLDCNGTPVTTCANCQGATLRCKTSCVSSCDQCPGPQIWVTCLHCPNSNVVRQTCAAIGAGGVASCTANLCPCDASADCPTVAGVSVLCGFDSTANSNRCLTCGLQGSSGAACESADGGAGTCHTAPKTPPVCE